MIDVYTMGNNDTGIPSYLGNFKSFGEAKQAQRDSLPDDLKEAYAGIQDGMPIFYADLLTPELLAKYPRLVRAA